jgi:hypothetical protein
MRCLLARSVPSILMQCELAHEPPCARCSIGLRAPSRSFVYSAWRCLGSIIIFSQIKLTRPDRVSAVARSPPPICPEGTALLSMMRIASKTCCTRASTSSWAKDAKSFFARSPLPPSSFHSFCIAKRRSSAAPRGEASNVWLASSQSRRTSRAAWSFGSEPSAPLGQTS